MLTSGDLRWPLPWPHPDQGRDALTQSCFVAGETRPLSRARGRLTKGSDKGRSTSRQGDQHSVLLCEGELVLAPHRIPLQGRGHTNHSQWKPSRQHVTIVSPTLTSFTRTHLLTEFLHVYWKFATPDRIIIFVIYYKNLDFTRLFQHSS